MKKSTIKYFHYNTYRKLCKVTSQQPAGVIEFLSASYVIHLNHIHCIYILYSTPIHNWGTSVRGLTRGMAKTSSKVNRRLYWSQSWKTPGEFGVRKFAGRDQRSNHYAMLPTNVTS